MRPHKSYNRAFKFAHSDDQSSAPRSDPSDLSYDPEITLVDHYQKLYTKVATMYAERLNSQTGRRTSDELIGSKSLARHLVKLACERIEEVNRTVRPHQTAEKTIASVTNFTIQFISLVIKYNRTEKLSDLFVEGLDKICVRTKPRRDREVEEKHSDRHARTRLPRFIKDKWEDRLFFSSTRDY